MIDRKTEPVFGVEGRLRVYPHISSLPGRQLISRTGHFGKGCKIYIWMHYKAYQLSVKNTLYYLKNRISEEGDSSYRRSSRYNPYPSGMGYGSLVGPRGIVKDDKWPCPPDRCKSYDHPDSGGGIPEQLLNGCASAVHISNKFHNKKNRPFLTRLVGDPIGKEADGETTIGDKNNVTKCIN